MPTAVQSNNAEKSVTSGRETIITTLYDLMTALNAQLEPDEADVVPTIVLHLCNSGRLKFTGKHQPYTVVCT